MAAGMPKRIRFASGGGRRNESNYQHRGSGVIEHEDFYEQVHGPESRAFDGKPHGWIQWKGTDVCIDLYCECGSHGHIDGDFLYHYKCAACGRKYALGMNVALIPLTEEQATYVENGGGCDFRTDESVLDDIPGARGS